MATCGKSIGLTFFINLVVGSILYMAIPSLVIPYSGVVLGGLRLVLGSTLFAELCHIERCQPDNRTPIGVLIVLEGEGYALAMLGSYVHGKSWLARRVRGGDDPLAGVQSRCAADAEYLWCSLPPCAAVAAVYEATLVILIIPHVRLL